MDGVGGRFGTFTSILLKQDVEKAHPCPPMGLRREGGQKSRVESSIGKPVLSCT
jgi:hypothetical protein